MRYTKNILFFLLFCILLLFNDSCTKNKKSTISPELFGTIQNIKKNLPSTIAEGLILTTVELEDSLLTIKYEIDERIYPFDNIIKAKQNRKELLLTIISSTNANERTSYKLYASLGITVNYHFLGKHSNKEVSIVVSPDEIKHALNNQCNTIEILRKQIEGERSTLPQMIGEGMVITNIELNDSMVLATVTLDEENYRFDDFEERIEEIKEDMRNNFLSAPIGLGFIQMMAKAQCGLLFSYIGSVSGKKYNIMFSPKEISIENNNYETMAKTVSDNKEFEK